MRCRLPALPVLLALAVLLSACSGGGAAVDAAAVADSSPGDSGRADGTRSDAARDVLADTTRGPDAGPDAGPQSELDRFIAAQLEAGAIPGLAAAIFTPDKMLWQGTYGFADVEAGKRVDARTLFIVASVSKTVTLLPLLQLVEHGRLGLDDALDDHLPFAVRHPTYPEVPLTARMLLTHTSGIEDDELALALTTYWGDPEISLAEFSRGYLTPGGAYYGQSNFGARPGSRPSYCNAAFGIVGALIEQLAGSSLRALSRDQLFAPLGMKDSGWFLADVDPGLLAKLYLLEGAQSQIGFAFYPAASLRTSVTDLSRFVRAMMRGGELDGKRAVFAQTLRPIWEVQFPEVAPAQALVWRYTTSYGGRYLEHSGSTLGGSAQVLVRDDAGVGLVVLTNSSAYLEAEYGLGDDGRKALEAVIRRLAAESELLAGAGDQ